MKIFKTLEILLKITYDCIGNPVTLSFHHHRFLILKQGLLDSVFLNILKPLRVSQQGGKHWAGTEQDMAARQQWSDHTSLPPQSSL